MLRIFQLEEILKATNNFSEDCLLGTGAFGNVYQGTFDKEILAIKKAHSESYMSTEEFINGKLKLTLVSDISSSKRCVQTV